MKIFGAKTHEKKVEQLHLAAVVCFQKKNTKTQKLNYVIAVSAKPNVNT